MTATSNLADLSSILPLYQRLKKATTEEVMAKITGNLARNLRIDLRKKVREKGSIRSSALERLASGRMIFIRPEVRQSVAARYASGKGLRNKTSAGKRLNIQQEMVRRELAVRESGRGVLSASVRFPALIQGHPKSVNRYGQLFATAEVKETQDRASGSVAWPGLSKASRRVIKGLHGVKGEEALREAIEETRKDALVYIQRKVAQLALKTVKKMHK